MVGGRVGTVGRSRDHTDPSGRVTMGPTVICLVDDWVPPRRTSSTVPASDLRVGVETPESPGPFVGVSLLHLYVSTLWWWSRPLSTSIRLGPNR